MAVARLRNPVVIAHPLTGAFISIARGMEFDDNDPIVQANAWAFDEPVEEAAATPGRKRQR